MIYLSDNDIVEKLAVCDLLDDALASYGAARGDVHVIPTLKLRIGGRARAKAERRLGGPAVARALDFLNDVRVIRDFSQDDYLLLDDIVDIDPGERILLSATALFAEYRLLTGDKRCLRVVATRPECQAIAHRIQGRVICFEQVLCRIIAHSGFNHVLAKVVPALSCDTAMRVAFGSGMMSTETNSVACLRNYVAELRALPVDLLMAGE